MGLRPEGVIQCEKSSVNSDGVNFKYVFVSNMRRTIETAVHLFKSHPNRTTIKFFVLPLLKEGFNSAYDLCL
jgi:broad specificity phosphatase PhoE